MTKRCMLISTTLKRIVLCGVLKNATFVGKHYITQLMIDVASALFLQQQKTMNTMILYGNQMSNSYMSLT